MTTEEQRKIFAHNLNYYVSLTGKRQKDIAKDIGVNYTTFNMWMLGKSMPTTGRIQHIADYFHIKNIDLINEKDVNSTPTKRQELIALVDSLTEEQAENLLTLMKSILNK